MTEITPAVLVENFSELNEKLAKFVNITKMIQIDICDGKFVPSTSWPFDELRAGQDKHAVGSNLKKILDEEEGMPFWNSIDFEFDLMVLNAHKQFEFFSKLGAKSLVFHVEAEDEYSFKEFLESLDPYWRDNIKIGVAINTTTDITKLEPLINCVDFVQCMGIEKVGFQGEAFDERVLKQIKDLRLKYTELSISVDGAVNEETAPLLLEAGANRLVIGSAILNSYDMRETIREFERL